MTYLHLHQIYSPEFTSTQTQHITLLKSLQTDTEHNLINSMHCSRALTRKIYYSDCEPFVGYIDENINRSLYTTKRKCGAR